MTNAIGRQHLLNVLLRQTHYPRVVGMRKEMRLRLPIEYTLWALKIPPIRHLILALIQVLKQHIIFSRRQQIRILVPLSNWRKSVIVGVLFKNLFVIAGTHPHK